MYSDNVSQPRARPCIFETKDPPRVRYVSYSRRIFHRGNFLDNLHRLINHHVDHVDEGQGYYNEETSFSSLPPSLSLSGRGNASYDPGREAENFTWQLCSLCWKDYSSLPFVYIFQFPFVTSEAEVWDLILALKLISRVVPS